MGKTDFQSLEKRRNRVPIIGKTRSWRGEASVCAAGLLWGTAGLWVHALEEAGLGPLQVVALRIWGAAAAFALAAAATRGGRRLFRVRWRDGWCFVGTGVVSVTGFSWCYFETIRTSSLALAAVLLYTAPVFVMLFSLWLFGERMTWRKGVACAMAMGGVALTAGLGGGSAGATPRALATGLLSGVGYALYSIFGRAALNRGYSARAIALWTFLCAAVALGAVAEPSRWLEAVRAGGTRTALAAAMLPFAATLLPYVLYTRGLESVSNGKASVLAFAEPLTACVLGVAVLGQAMTGQMGCGVALVFAALCFLVAAR
ncbi:MAG: EamA family transporter [Kiritimatiellae bacterium]|nr:EamA family transporter [Kiritimatiellia bacterium]